jgi:hypothetical protein
MCGSTSAAQIAAIGGNQAGIVALVVWWSCPTPLQNTVKLPVHFVLDGLWRLAVAHLHGQVFQSFAIAHALGLGQMCT